MIYKCDENVRDKASRHTKNKNRFIYTCAYVRKMARLMGQLNLYVLTEF